MKNNKPTFFIVGAPKCGTTALANFLRKTEQYHALKDQIQKQGQKDPCIITHDGLLIDGNTSCVTLQDIAKEYQRNLPIALLSYDHQLLIQSPKVLLLFLEHQSFEDNTIRKQKTYLLQISSFLYSWH